MILAFNTGSTALKYAFFDGAKEVVRGEGRLESIGDKLKEYNYKIDTTVHRIVCAGPRYLDPLEITTDLLEKIQDFTEVAPLHNPSALEAIRLAKGYFAGARHFAVFDSGFFKNLSDTVASYALPRQLVDKYDLRRYGYHGLSHEYATRRAADALKLDYTSTKIISCHLGGGSSVAALSGGQAIDTSMGFSPFSGLPMMTRSGDIDPFIPLYLQKKENQGPEQMENILANKSGLGAVAGLGNDMKEILVAESQGNQSARLAIEMFIYQVRKYIGAYYLILGGCGLIVFTGAIGARSERIRNGITEALPFKAQIYFTETDEEKMMVDKIKHLL